MDIPCKDCIVLPMCKLKLKKWTDPPDITTFSTMIKCSLISLYVRWIAISYYGNELISKVNELRSFYKLPKLPRLRENHGDLVVLDKEKRDKNVFSVLTVNSCDCNLAKINKKDCEHEIVRKLSQLNPPRRV